MGVQTEMMISEYEQRIAELEQQLAEAQADAERYLAALIDIRDSKYCQYHNTSDDSYGLGVADGHRHCSKTAGAAIDAAREVK